MRILCFNCNKEIDSDSKFCPNCGTPLKDNINESKRDIVYEGTIYKCPNCGEILNSFAANCLACGYELRNVKKISAVSELANKLEEIEKKRDPDTELKLMRMRGLYGTAAVGLSPIDEQKISLIQNFSIPNTKEDLYEFLILSKSNINSNAYSALPFDQVKKALSNAWKSKFEQAYLKAKILFKDDYRLLEINKMYEEMNKTINHRNLGFWIILIVLIVLPYLLLFMPIIFFKIFK